MRSISGVVAGLLALGLSVSVRAEPPRRSSPKPTLDEYPPTPARIHPRKAVEGDRERKEAAETKRARKAAKWAKQGGL